MKTTLLSIALIITSAASYGQQLKNNYVKTFGRTNLSSTPLITTLKSGNYLITQDTLDYEVDASSGTATPKYRLSKADILPKAITTSGDYIYVAGRDNNRFPAVAKLDMNMDTVWNKHILETKYQNAEAILVDNGTIYTCGPSGYSSVFIAKMDANGDTLWTSNIPQTTFCNLTCLIKLGDGNFLAGGNLDDYPLAIKFDATGKVLWTYTENIFISFSKASAFENGGGDVVLLARNHLITLEGATGAKKDSKSTGNVDFYDALTTGIDTVYLFGTHKDAKYNGNHYPVVEVRYLSLDSVKSYTYTSNVHPLVNNSFTRVVSLGGTEFAATGLLRDSVNLSANEWNIMAAKFNGIGTVSTSKIITVENGLTYPNPTTGIINFKEQVGNVIVYSLEGKQVLSFTGKNYAVDLSNIQAGSYIVTWMDQYSATNQNIVIKE